VTRLLSGAALLAFAVAVVWLAPPVLFVAVAELLLILAFSEYARLASAVGVPVPPLAAGAAAVLTSLTFAFAARPDAGPMATGGLEAVLMSSVIALAALAMPGWRGERDALARAAAALFPSLYLALPIGAMIAIRAAHGPAALFLLMLTIVASDTAQYYTGRLAGKRPLAPAISPKKTVEGAIGGFVFGTLLLAIVGTWWLAPIPLFLRIALGLAVVALGIAGDLFESMLKRSAGVKDSSTLIPGHGGVLDRIDALLFAAPVYYVVLKYL
jgi:phosphatidate cytidylyltransferase